MIVKMSKYAFMVYYKEYDAFLNQLGSLGVVDIKESDCEKDRSSIEKLVIEKKQLQAVLRTLEKVQEEQKAKDKKKKIERAEARSTNIEDGAELVRRIEQLNEQISEQQIAEIGLEKEISQMAIWGNFEFSTISSLKQAGWAVDFFQCPSSKYDTHWENEYHAILVNQLQSLNYFITITPVDTSIEIEAERFKLSDKSLVQLEESLKEEQKKTKELHEQLVVASIDDFETLNAYNELLSDSMELENAQLQTNSEADQKLMLLEGWIPTSQEKALETSLDEKSFFYKKLEITADDHVPILFRNNMFSRLFEPISRLYMLPKYNEIDLTPFFAPFFMVFFGLCLGDSGYGLFLLVVASLVKIFMKSKLKPEVKSILSLVQILGTSTFFCGLLTGAFFGFNLYDLGIPAFDELKKKVALDNNQMFTLALILGVIQIVFGMCLNAANRIIQHGFVYGLSMIGWIVLIISLIFSSLFPQWLPMFGTVHLIILTVSAIFIFFFNSPGKNPLLNFGLGLWDSYNMATGLLGDILSYVRLFALGLSGGILASVFNSLAIGMSPDNAVLGPIVMLIIFIIGHGINIFMNVLGAIVHPMRLTFVEFFKNSGYEGGGKAYTPFKWNMKSNQIIT